VDVARRFFGALSSEPAGSRAALQEAVGSLAGAYALAAQRRQQLKDKGQGAAAAAAAAAAGDGGGGGGGGADVEGELQELLLGALGSDQPAVRLCAIQVRGGAVVWCDKERGWWYRSSGSCGLDQCMHLHTAFCDPNTTPTSTLYQNTCSGSRAFSLPTTRRRATRALWRLATTSRRSGMLG